MVEAGEEVADVRRLSRRPWLAAAALLWLPALLPFAVGPLTECEHCVLVYLRFFVIAPGFLAGGLAMHLLPWGGMAVMGVVTAALFLLLRFALGGPRRGPGSAFGWAVAIAAPVCSAVGCLLLAAMLRM